MLTCPQSLSYIFIIITFIISKCERATKALSLVTPWCSTTQSSNSTTQREIHTFTTPTRGRHHPVFFLLFHSCVSECSCHSFWIIVHTLSIVLFSTYLYFTLEYLEVELVSLLMADYFGFCPVVVSLIEGFSTLNLVSPILYHFLCFVVFI